jgi:hypothetical protein
MYRRTIIAAVAGVTVGAVTGGDTDTAHTGSTATDERAVPDDEPDSDRNDDDPNSDRDDGRPAFELAPFELTPCGATCRDVTATLANTGNADATDVSVFVTVFDEETPLWEAEDAIGRLAAGDSVTRTHRIEVDLGTALALRDETVTIDTLVESDQHTERIVREEELSQ